MNTALMIARRTPQACSHRVGWRNHERAVHPPPVRKQERTFFFEKKNQKTFVL